MPTRFFNLYVFAPDDEALACTRYARDAAAIIIVRGIGYQIRLGKTKRRILWNEGAEDHPAEESVDYVEFVVDYRRKTFTAGDGICHDVNLSRSKGGVDLTRSQLEKNLAEHLQVIRDQADKLEAELAACKKDGEKGGEKDGAKMFVLTKTLESLEWRSATARGIIGFIGKLDEDEKKAPHKKAQRAGSRKPI